MSGTGAYPYIVIYLTHTTLTHTDWIKNYKELQISMEWCRDKDSLHPMYSTRPSHTQMLDVYIQTTQPETTFKSQPQHSLQAKRRTVSSVAVKKHIQLTKTKKKKTEKHRHTACLHHWCRLRENIEERKERHLLLEE